MDYNRQFGTGDNAIELLVLEQPMELGLIGMLTSKRFENAIGLVQDEEYPTDGSYNYACLYVAQKTHGIIHMNKELIAGLRQGDRMPEMVLLHEVGHYVHNDLRGRSKGDDDEAHRLAMILRGEVAPKELAADAFAAEYLGAETAAAIDDLKHFTIQKFGQDDKWNKDDLAAATRELELRAEYLRAGRL